MVRAPDVPAVEVTLLPKAERDMRRVHTGERKRIADALRLLAAGAENLDVKALRGVTPWLRLRVGNYRVLCTVVPSSPARSALVVARIVDRRDLDRAIVTLGKPDEP
jgi:mRNA-degrading endonuclease RelE of RelBE toxin-antitoxin system